MTIFTARIKDINIKNCVDLSKSVKITLFTEDAGIAGELEKIPADVNVTVKITYEIN